ncbi:hypothetical protein GCM10010176_101070 [Nonomuraea spiralis]|nr:hypothetical protein GCM10010176_101070 [Nonomuraea spiralis]
MLSGWKRWLLLPGADLQTFTDVPLPAGPEVRFCAPERKDCR